MDATEKDETAPGPLAGIRIVDLSQVLAGPVATMLLADQGAEVIKVEPLEGDTLRHNRQFHKNEVNALMMNANRGKRSIAVDLKRPEGIEVVKELASTADVFIQNFRTGVIERLGIEAETLRASNDRLITVWISGFGRSGPKATNPVFDPVIQAVSGHAAVQLNPEIPFPDIHRTTVIDKSTALTAAQAISTALFARERNGRGQHIDIAMLDVALSFFWVDGAMGHTLVDEDVSGGTTLYEVMALRQCVDGYMTFFIANEDHWQGLFRGLGHPEWSEDPRWADPDERDKPENLGPLGAAISSTIAGLERDQVVAQLDDQDVPAAPMLTLDEIPDWPQVVHNGSLHEWLHPVAGRARQAKPAANFSGTPYQPRWSMPMLGEHTDAILDEALFDADRISRLRAEGVIA